MELKERPLYVPIRCSRSRKLALWLRNAILDFCLMVQNMLVLSSKFIFLISVLIASHGSLHENSNSEEPSDSSSSNPGEGESGTINSILRCDCKGAKEWISRGRKKKPANMMELLKKSTISEGFRGVRLFDCGDIPSLIGDEPPNCWDLPLVTLASISMAIAYSWDHNNSIDPLATNLLILGFNEGLEFVRIIEKKLDTRKSTNGPEAADIVWQEIELYQRWLDVNLHQFAPGENNPVNLLKKLAGIAKDHVEKKASGGEQNTAIPARDQRWPAELLAANSMYRISHAILPHFSDESSTHKELVEWLQITIADILGACLTNLPRVLSMQCSHVAMHSKEESAREAANLLGEAEEALGFLGNLQSTADLDVERIAYIDNWLLNKVMKTEEVDACV